MNLKSYLINSPTGIHTVTNVQVKRVTLYKPVATDIDNRKGELNYLGYFKPDMGYEFTPDFTEVFQYQLVSTHGKNETLITVLDSQADGWIIQQLIWKTLKENPKDRMVDLMEFLQSKGYQNLEERNTFTVTKRKGVLYDD